MNPSYKKFLNEADTTEAGNLSTHHADLGNHHERKSAEFRKESEAGSLSSLERESLNKISKAHEMVAQHHHDAANAHRASASYAHEFGDHANKLSALANNMWHPKRRHD